MSDPIPRAAPPPPVRTDPWWRWRRNPLRRRGDVLQAWLGVLFAVAVGTATPLAGLAAGAAAHDILTTRAEREADAGRHATAELLEDVPEPGAFEAGTTTYPAEVRYAVGEGTARTGTAEVAPGLTAGDRVTVWTGRDGAIAEPPMDPEEIRYRSIGWGALAGSVVLVAGKVVHAVVVRAIERRRIAAWDEAWRRTATRWTLPS
ncbi:hypothetical protein [Streptomyces radicis]|uniref:Uncharacterized protein n=1 Tax=Streptomyces radicis TaxID=1750517 RepID=A0A3A9WRS9_9ACTN|nr:hypothetical protein [Streptomyces radicis]RKN10486.1 hypothetical protein D7319_08620 [Streptomyces radicis]RKN24745.1 hypothetical protein D7318_09795 [Streptomyces radicis]